MRNKSSATNKLSETLVMGLLLCICCSVAMSLPEDEFQELKASASRNEIDMVNGIVVYYGTTENPAVITRGSMRISGLTITVEQENGELMKVTAEGNPARFQQQPEIDQEIVYGRGEILVFDNTRQFLTMDSDAELIQGGSSLNAHHIDYDLDTRRINAYNNGDGDQVEMVIPPSMMQ